MATKMTKMTEAPRVLVTGASGFLGRAAAARLPERGAGVIGTHSGRPPPRGLERVTWEQVDLLDPRAVAGLMERHRPTHLLALAWYMGPGNQTAPENYDWLQRSIDLLRAFAAAGGRRVAFCGSCMEYDWSVPAPLGETATPLRPDTDYGAAKAALFTAYGPLCRQLGLSAAWLRPFFLYGPGESRRRLVADVITSMLEGREALCTHGRQERDFLHVADVAEAAVRVLLSDAEGPFNIGSGRAVSLAALAEEAARQIGRPDLLKLGARPAREGEAPLVLADTARIAALGWRPAFDLETGLADTIDWWRRELTETVS